MSERIALSTLLAYGPPSAAYGLYLFFVQFYFLKFATDVLLLAPAAIGVIFGAGRLWDALSDPLVGNWSDRTRTRLGRRRPWLFCAIPLLAASFFMIWNPPSSLDSRGLLWWSGVALFAFYTAFTLYTVPYNALGAELASDHHERSRVFGAQAMSFTVGILLAFAAIQYMTNASDPRAAAGALSVWMIGALSVILLIPPSLLRERPEHQGRGGDSPYAALRDVLRNPHARRLLSVWFVNALGTGVLGILAPYLTQYVLRRPDLTGWVPAFFVISSVASIPFWVWLSRRFGKRDVWVVALFGTSLFFGATFFVQPGGVTLLCALMIGAGASVGCGQAIGPSMLADVIDYDEYQTGQRKEGAYSAAWGFALKVAFGFVIMLTGFALQLAGFQPNIEQTPTAELTLRGLFAGAPFVAALTGALLLRRFSLTRAEHARIRGELAQRQPGAGSG